MADVVARGAACPERVAGKLADVAVIVAGGAGGNPGPLCF